MARIKSEEELVREKEREGFAPRAALERARAEKEAKEDVVKLIHDIESEARETADARARDIVAMSIQRYAGETAVENTTNVVAIPSDEMKGRVIGKEGRNIKAIEHLTGTEIIVDDTPQAVTVSSFSPIRRQVARRAIEMLMKDGRIQPARIEESIQTAKKELALEMKKAGEEAIAVGSAVSALVLPYASKLLSGG